MGERISHCYEHCNIWFNERRVTHIGPDLAADLERSIEAVKEKAK